MMWHATSMLPMRTSSIFKSRWMALIWSAGIIWFAVDVAGQPDESGNEPIAGYGNIHQPSLALENISAQ